MSQAKVVDAKPTAIALEIGTYRWSSCGFSESNPFCNGSHQRTDLKPFTLKWLSQSRLQYVCVKRRVTLLSVMTLIRIFRR
jgi:CDGSH iron-sulfur domain-containing protein 3